MECPSPQGGRAGDNKPANLDHSRLNDAKIFYPTNGRVANIPITTKVDE